ncbi:DNA polymerase I [Parasediminibacterium sp. JCM 36343]|uniref:DNA polymerase I n=1 Tax=Parasediminibacterium sp. JCM 36343 TaxID=3374279 RepID=UPI00397E83D4
MQKKLFLLDAFALIFRAYYALIRNPRITSKGRNTNAQFGFTNTLIDLMNKEKPSHLAVCFDMEGPTERHTDFADYKANRQDAPEDLILAIPDIKRLVEAFNIPVVGVTGYEADDVIGTLAWEAHDAGYEVFMVTPDKDYGQLVRDGINIYKPGYQGGDVEIMGPAEVCAKWNIDRVDQVIDILGLMGDAVDNIPGIAGVGEKTAAKLLKEYDTLEGVLANAETIKGALGEKIRAGKENAIMSKKLATIITNVPVAFHEEEYKLKEWNKEALQEIFAELEFRTMAQRLGLNAIPPPVAAPLNLSPNKKSSTSKAATNQGSLFDAPPAPSQGGASVAASSSGGVGLFGSIFEQEAPSIINEEIASGAALSIPPLGDVGAMATIHTTPHQYEVIDTANKISGLIGELQSYSEICFDTETTHIDANEAELVGLSFSVVKGEGYYVPCPAEKEGVLGILTQLKPLFDNENIIWVGQNIKYDLLMLKWYGFELKGNLYDTMLAHYVIEPEGRRSMDLLSSQYLHYEPVHIAELIGKKVKGQVQFTMRDIEIEKIKEYAAEDADITLQLKHTFEPLVAEKEVGEVLEKAENPLVKVLTDMEFEGVRIDMPFLKDYSVELEREAKIFEENVYNQAGVRFNLASPKQLGEVLFDKLKLDPKAKKTKTGQYATGEDVLMKLSHQHKIVADILGFRQLTKLKSTYIDALPLMINSKTGRVHTSYAQAVAVTGRLSSNNPNLQNIPIRSERGREIRKAFIPRDSNHILVSADYSQIELRIVAAISGDPNMCEAFRLGKDIHTATAAKVYGIDEAEVTKEQRYKAKSVNFGIIYGQGAFGLADNLGISRTEAKEIIDNYKKEFVGITTYMADTINFAQEHGYVKTLLGRKRWLRDITSSNFTVRGYAERNAVNSPIQGTAADMIKLAMIKIHAAIKEQKLQSKMILQVHDELVFDALKEEVDILKPLILENMKTALILPNDVPVEAEVGVGENWLEAH